MIQVLSDSLLLRHFLARTGRLYEGSSAPILPFCGLIEGLSESNQNPNNIRSTQQTGHVARHVDRPVELR